MLVLAIFGVAYASIAPQAMTNYWTILGPVFGIICVATQWRAVEAPHLDRGLSFGCRCPCDVSRASGERKANDERRRQCIVVLILLALGTVTAGIRHAAGWRVCLVGAVLGLGVRAIAWLEQATLLLLLIATVLVAIAVLYIMHNRRERGY
jgi:hypothetical protein